MKRLPRSAPVRTVKASTDLVAKRGESEQVRDKADAVPKAKKMKKEMKAKEESKVGCSVAQSTDCYYRFLMSPLHVF